MSESCATHYDDYDNHNEGPMSPPPLNPVEGEPKGSTESFFDDALEIAKEIILPDLDDTKIYPDGLINPTSESRIRYLLRVAEIPVENCAGMLNGYNNLIKHKRLGLRLDEHVPPVAVAVELLIKMQEGQAQKILATAIALNMREQQRQKEEKGILGTNRWTEICSILVYAVDSSAFTESYRTAVDWKITRHKKLRSVK